MKKIVKLILCICMICTSMGILNGKQAKAFEIEPYAVAKRIFVDETYANDDYYFECEHEKISFTIRVQGEYVLTSDNITYASMSGSISTISNYQNIDVEYVSISTTYTSKIITVYVTVRYLFDGEELGMLTKTIKVIE